MKNPVHGHGTGFTLLEMAIALLATSLVALGTINLAQAFGASGRLQQNLSALDENARFALQSIGAEVKQAGHPRQWWDAALPDPFDGSADSANAAGDRLVVRRWSNRNCFENDNPVRDAKGDPDHHLRISTFEVSRGQLSLTCEYGPDDSTMVRQLNRLGLVEHVAGLQFQFAVDLDFDGIAEAWTSADSMPDDAVVTGVRAGLLLLSPGRYVKTGRDNPVILDGIEGDTPSDRLWRVSRATWPVMAKVQS